MTNNLCLLALLPTPSSIPKNRAGGRGKRAKVTTKISQSPEAAQPRCLRRTERMHPPCHGERLPEGFGAAPGDFRAGFASPEGFEGRPNPSRVMTAVFPAPGCVVFGVARRGMRSLRMLLGAGSQNHRIKWVGRDFQRQPSPIPLQEAGTPSRSGCSPWKCQKRDAVPGNARRGMLGAGCLERDHRRTE